MGKFLKVVGVTIISATGLASGVSPEEAISNLASWWNLISPTDNAPSWLTQQVDTFVLVGSLIVLMAMLILPRVFNRTEKSTPKKEQEKQPEEPETTDEAEINPIQVRLNESEFEILDYECICAIIVQNHGSSELPRCSACIEQLTASVRNDTPIPFALRTERQIGRQRSGRFSLLAGESERIPIIFRNKTRRIEWFIFDENGRRHLMSYGNAELVLGVYCDRDDSRRLLQINTVRNFNIDVQITEITRSAPALIQSQTHIGPTDEQVFNEFVEINELESKIEEIQRDQHLSVIEKDNAIREIQQEIDERKRQMGGYYNSGEGGQFEAGSGRISLSEAARKVYEVTKDKFTATIAEFDGRVEMAYAIAFFTTSDVPIYGKAPASQVAVEIPRHYLTDLRLSDDVSELRDARPNGKHFIGLEINESDIPTLVNIIKGAPC